MRKARRDAPKPRALDTRQILSMSGSAIDPDGETLWQDDELILRRVADAGATPELILQPVSAQASPAVYARLQRSHAIGVELDASWAVLPRTLGVHGGRPALWLADPGGELLVDRIGRVSSFAEFLQLAIGLAAAVRKMHECRLVHQDIRPSNLFVDVRTAEVRLTGFGIAARLPYVAHEDSAPAYLEASAAYTAPEQSGRMNRAVDQRSDLYAVGVTLYELASETLPFVANTAAEWIYAHLARVPAPLDRQARAVPPQLAALIMKLLAKSPDERYQTAAGLEADLRTCFTQWQAQGRIDPFLLAARDAAQRPKKPQRLYGRAVELEALVAAHNRVALTGTPELVVVSGRSGTGKSTLIAELLKGLSREGSLVVSAKFDRVSHDISYATIARALTELVHSMLSRTEAELGSYRAALIEAVGELGRLVVELVPELALLLGPTGFVPEVAPEAAKVRLRRLLLRVLSALARAEVPLVLVLDDLQWVDRATLELLRDLTKDGDARHVLLLGAYREEEVDADHRLALAVADLRAHGVHVHAIVLGPLADLEAAQLVADALRLTRSEVAPLAEAMIAKTGGNPFFLVEFMMALADEGLLAWDIGAVTWIWDLPRIFSTGFTDNIVDLMLTKLKRLPDVTREVLKLLASLGSIAEPPALALLSGRSVDELERLIAPAEADGLIARQSTHYKFIHDRVQEAAYALIPEHERPAMQLRIARLLFATLDGAARERQLFELTTYFLRGASLIETERERSDVAALSLAAARRAREARAYSAAAAYLAAGAELLRPDCWQTSYELSFAIAFLHAECQLLHGEPLAAEARYTRLAARAVGPHDRARVACRRADVYLALDRHRESIDVCLEYLAQVRIALPAQPTDEALRAESDRLERALESRTVESLIELPAMTTPESLSAMTVLMALLPAAELLGERVRELAALRMANLTLEQGLCAPSAVAFAELSRTLGDRAGPRDLATSFGKLALSLVERDDYASARGRVYHLVSDHVLPWSGDITHARTMMRRAYDLAADAGDHGLAALSLLRLISLSFASGERLEQTQQLVDEALEFGRRNGVRLFVQLLQKMQRLLEELRGERVPLPPEPAPIAELPVPGMRGWFCLRRLARCVIERDDAGALQELAVAESRWFAQRTAYERAEYRYYEALAHAAVGDVAAVAMHCRELALYAVACPSNFAPRATLVAAELARLEGRPLDAEPLYEAAIDTAIRSGFLHEEALAYERAAEFYAGRRLAHAARAFRERARAAYLRWGALPKAHTLEDSADHLSTVARPVAEELAEKLDLATVIELSRAVSSELILDRLVERLIGMATEYAGATRGLLVLRTRDGHRTEAEALAGDKNVTVRIVRAPVSATDLPLTLFRNVLRTRQRVSLDDASEEVRFASDPYFVARQARSILCLPLVKQTEVIGVLYLENELSSHVFTEARVAILRMLASQAAVSLENAQLYQDLKRVEVHLAEAQTLSHTGSFGWNTVDNSISLSDEARAIYGFSKGTRQSADDVLRIVHPDDRERTARLASTVSSQDQDFINDFRIITADGTLKHVRTVGHASQRDPGLEYVGAIMDVTAAKRAEADLQRAHLLLAGAQRLSHTGSIGWNVATGEVYWSDETYAIYGVEPGTKASPERVLESIHPDDVERVTRQVEQVVSEGKDWVSEFRMVMADGAVKHVHVVARVAAWEQGNREYIGAIRDVTSEKLAEARLRASERRYAVTLSSIADGVIATDEQARVSFMNPVAEALTGIANEAALGQPIDEVFRVVLEQGHAMLLSRQGQRIPIDERRSPIVHGGGDPSGVVIVFHDITDRLRAEEASALQLANERLQLANDMKDLFLANVSHEIRTPMNAILGMTELMLEDPLTELQRSRLSIAKSAGDNLLVLIDDLLDFSKIEAGKVELLVSEFSLREAVQESVGTLATRAVQKGLLLHAEVDTAVPDLLIGDRGRVRQVLINLLGNAVKFTVRGRVFLRVELAESLAQRVALRFSVRDTGIGIPADKQASIFQAFTQQDTSTTRTYGGTGLGLTIAMRLASAMSGEITVESTAGRGSTFTFLAWFARRSEASDAHPSPREVSDVRSAGAVHAPTKLHILVAEDNEFNADLMLQLIARRGHHASMVTRGDDVLARLEHGGVDLLLLDLHMPGLDGFQVIEQIRARERVTGKHLPVVAVTARARPADRERCLDSGMDEFVSKPVKAAALWSIVDRLLSDTLAGASSSAGSSEGARRPLSRTSYPAWLDAAVLLGACDGDPKLLAKILSSLRVQLPAELAQAAASLQRADALALRESAHKLCAMIAVVCTPSACSEVTALEEHAARGALHEAGRAFALVQELSERMLSGLGALTVLDLQALAAHRVEGVEDA